MMNEPYIEILFIIVCITPSSRMLDDFPCLMSRGTSEASDGSFLTKDIYISNKKNAFLEESVVSFTDKGRHRGYPETQ